MLRSALAACALLGLLALSPTGCADEDTGLRDDCKASCDNLGFFDCITEAEQAGCRDGCANAATSLVVTDFIDCEQAATPGCDGTMACLAILGTGGGNSCLGSDLGLCQAQCDFAEFSSCISQAEREDCRSHCTDSELPACRTFAECSGGSDCSSLQSCWTQFRDN